MNKNKKPKMTKNDLKTAKRLMKYVTEKYKFQFILVFFCILISAVATTAVSLSLRYLLDDFILPLVGQKTPDFAGLYKALTVLGVIFLAGVIATFIYTRMMVYIGQGVLKRVRDDMFEHMQTLPIRYFDQNTNGSIMSLYTNDTDTLRQMISQAIPQALMALFTIVVTFISMLVLSPLLTILAVVIIFVMLAVTGRIGLHGIDAVRTVRHRRVRREAPAAVAAHGGGANQVAVVVDADGAARHAAAAAQGRGGVVGDVTLLQVVRVRGHVVIHGVQRRRLRRHGGHVDDVFRGRAGDVAHAVGLFRRQGVFAVRQRSGRFEGPGAVCLYLRGANHLVAVVHGDGVAWLCAGTLDQRTVIVGFPAGSHHA